ncbi:MAG: deoxyguanosinetriphosphate triphosphohydrolase, partial [Gammaproteobacteria bacterium]
LIEQSRANLAAAAPADIESVRALSRPLIGFSEPVRARNRELSQFLRARLYQHPRVQSMTERATRIVSNLFRAFFSGDAALPDTFAHQLRDAEASQGAAGRARVVADYIAGMTDRYAEREYNRLTGHVHTAGPARTA